MAKDMRRKSYLTLKPIDLSLTAGTNIPSPLHTPPKSPLGSARPPTAGGGPLSSHPTSADDIPGEFPPTPEPDNERSAKRSSSSSSNTNMDRTDSFRTPASPSSPNRAPSKSSDHKNSNVRKLFSLNNLRNSFSSSRTSLHAGRGSTDTAPPPTQPEPNKRTGSNAPQMRQRSKSGSWFKRKSGMFMYNGPADLDAVVEDRPETRDSARNTKEDTMKEDHNPAPLLPELKSLGNGTTNGGDLGWDEGMFKK